ncbi:hypothetical protein [Pontixanthobacter sp. CEM42]|uniref:hypothetical protein n=1 Tax=Pontixanthobacter sp. CEM42 TaxID=2792077 RepID=UPI001ADF8B63|nr:hypothetical protein [Pontixanthobacter sp. CEM42]
MTTSRFDVRAGLSAAVLALTLTSCADEPGDQLDSETRDIIRAALESQADIPSQYAEWFAEHPEEKSNLPSLFDQRLCVKDELAGTTADFRMTREAADADGSAPGLNPREKREMWDNVRVRSTLPRDIKPKHLRWDGPLRYCVNGVLWMSHPEVDGDNATIFIQNECTGWCGWGGVLELKRDAGGWKAGELSEWWVS